MGLRLKKLFPNEDIKQYYSVLRYRTDFILKKNMLVIEIDELGHTGRIQTMKAKDKKNQKIVLITLLELILIKNISMTMENLVQLALTLPNQLKN